MKMNKGQKVKIKWTDASVFSPIILFQKGWWRRLKMKKLTEEIYNQLLSRKSALVIGCTDSGKTHYVLTELTPFLKGKKLNVICFPNCNDLLNIPNNTDVAIIDEVETLMDREFLEQQYPNDRPYYSAEYLEKVKNWHNKLKNIKIPSVFILTRNGKKDIKYLIENLKTMDWGTAVKCFVFEKDKN